jgi:copper chaperone CopZ
LGAPAPARAEVRRLAFPVSGMHSPLATRGVEEAIHQLPGVARVSADLGSGRVEVEAESQKSLNLQDVRTRAARAGYPVAGDLDILARGRFETGAEGRITFKITGTTYAWQVLESGTLLEIARSHPGLRGEFVAGFRLFERPVWNRPAISLTGWEAIPPPGLSAPPAAAKPLRPTAESPAVSGAGAAKPGSTGKAPAAGRGTGSAAKPLASASKARVAAKPAVAKSDGSKPAVQEASKKKKAGTPPPQDDPKKKKKRHQDPQDPEKP